MDTVVRLSDVRKSLDPKIKITAENKCGFCSNTLCCTYITQQIDTPTKKTEFEHLLWQVSHKNVEIYKDEDGWYLLIAGRCDHIQTDGRCGIYDARPEICRHYSNDYCEFDASSAPGFDLYFRNYDELLSYCKKRFKKWTRG